MEKAQQTKGYVMQDYDPAWQGQFEAEEKNLRDLFGTLVHRIEHEGSTSVPGMYGKPVIDILVLVDDLMNMDKLLPFKAAGYEARAGVDPERSRIFEKFENGMRKFLIHVFAKDHREPHKMILNRDYLRAHPAEVKMYSDLKKNLFKKYGQDYAAYRREKKPFLDELSRKAFDWKIRTQPKHLQ